MGSTRRTWLGTTLAGALVALAGLFAPARARAAPAPPPPRRKRARWIGHY